MVLVCLPPNCLNAQYPPNIVIIPFLDFPVFKLRYSLAHGIVLHFSPFIFNFLGTFTNKVSNFLAVIALAFILINGSTSHPRASHIWTVIKSAWSKVSVSCYILPLLVKFWPLGRNVPLFWFLLLSHIL